MNNPNPTCEKDCRFTAIGGSRTCAYYQPTYDKHGNNLNPDRNTTFYTLNCSVCNRRWAVSEQGGKTTVDEITCTPLELLGAEFEKVMFDNINNLYES